MRYERNNDPKNEPQLLVADMERSILFYAGQLGFELDFRYEAFYAGVVKNGHSIHLKLGRPAVKEKDDLTIVFGVEDVKLLLIFFPEEGFRSFRRCGKCRMGRSFTLPTGWARVGFCGRLGLKKIQLSSMNRGHFLLQHFRPPI